MARLEITAMTFGPYGVGRLDGKTVMVPNCAPGDLLEIELESERHDYATARLLDVIRPGPDRRSPPCRFLPRCGGCDWQQIDYRAQVRIKAELIAGEIGRALEMTVDPAGLIEPAPAEFGYRARIRLMTAAGRLGFRQLRGHELVEIDKCIVADGEIRLPQRLAEMLRRNLSEIEVAKDGDRNVLIVHLLRPPGQTDVSTVRDAIRNDSGIAGVVMRSGSSRRTIGDASIAIELEPGLEIRVDADLFSQVNHAQNRSLVAFVMNAVREGARVLDLFCGAGNFSLPAARHGADVSGADADQLAIAAATANAQRLGLKRARFSTAKAAEIARFLLRARARPDLVILDPPRAGAGDLMNSIAKLRAAEVIYVSCNLTTLARDLRAIARCGYQLQRLRAFDFFPNTHHAEVVAHAVLT